MIEHDLFSKREIKVNVRKHFHLHSLDIYYSFKVPSWFESTKPFDCSEQIPKVHDLNILLETIHNSIFHN